MQRETAENLKCGHPATRLRVYVYGSKSHRKCLECESARCRRRRAEFAERVRAQNRASNARSRANNPSRDRKYFLKRKYGLTETTFLQLLDAQHGRCRICETALAMEGPRATVPHIDHDHATGRVRGILCMHCNTALGYLRDSPDWARRAAAYIEASR